MSKEDGNPLSQEDKKKIESEVNKIIYEHKNKSFWSKFLDSILYTFDKQIEGISNAFKKFVETQIGGVAEDTAEKAVEDTAKMVSNKTLKKIFKYLNIALKGYNKFDDFQDGMNIYMELPKAYQNSYKIGTADENLKFQSLREWFDFYEKIDAARIKDLEKASYEEKFILEREYELFDALMANELERYMKLTESMVEYDKYRKVDYSLSSLLAKITNTEKASSIALIEHKAREKKINEEHDRNKLLDSLFKQGNIYSPIELPEVEITSSSQDDYGVDGRYVEKNYFPPGVFNTDIPRQLKLYEESIQKKTISPFTLPPFPLSDEEVQKQLESYKTANNDILNEYQSLTDKYIKIEEDYNKRKEELEASRNPDNTEQIDQSLSELEDEKEKLLLALNDDIIQAEKYHETWCNQVVNLSLKGMSDLLNRSAKKLNEAKASDIGGVDFLKEGAKKLGKSATSDKKQLKNGKACTRY